MKDGILVADKPPGMTSFDVIARVRALTGLRKIGHGGTLDPMATGVLPLFLGAATKAQDRCPDRRKRYTATARLGVATDTGDITGSVRQRAPVECSALLLQEILPAFIGRSNQLPPMYSAVRVNGQRLYKLARKGREVEREPREIEIYSIEIKDLDLAQASITLDILCSSGTYIRTLCEDIAKRAGTLACLSALRRTLSCSFTLDDAWTLEEIQQAAERESLDDLLIPVHQLFAALKRVELQDDLAGMFLCGVPIAQDKLEEPAAESENISVWFDGRFIGLARYQDGQFIKTMHYSTADKQ